MQFDVVSHWYCRHFTFLTLLLWPFSRIFSLIIKFRRYLYNLNILKKIRLPVPVIIVGNITVGGTGKTPFVIWLTQFLKAQGYNVGIVTRGVGGEKKKPYEVLMSDSATTVGDEAVLLKQKTDSPVFIGKRRAEVAQKLLTHYSCDVVISDDGLQHYQLDRNFEIALIDKERGFGNGCLLPAGPLRESISRLKKVDLVINHGLNFQADMQLQPRAFYSIKNLQKIDCAIFTKQYSTVHGVTGIGHPQRFFNLLKKMGLTVIPHVFPDHYPYRLGDFQFDESFPIVMTEKDAVKCKDFADENYWCLSVEAEIKKEIGDKILEKLAVSHRGSFEQRALSGRQSF